MINDRAASVVERLLASETRWVFEDPPLGEEELQRTLELLDRRGIATAVVQAEGVSDFEMALWRELDRAFGLEETHAWNWNAVEEGLEYLVLGSRRGFVTVIASADKAKQRYPTGFQLAFDVLVDVADFWNARGVVFRLLLT